MVVNRACFDPFNAHKKLIKNQKDLKIVNDSLRAELANIRIESHLGLKICRNCVRKAKTFEVTNDENAFAPDTDRQVLEDLNKSVSALGSPIKIDQVVKLSLKRRAAFVETKTAKIKDKLSKVMGEAIGVPEPISQVDHHATLMKEVKTRVHTSTRGEQIKLLTLVPTSWPRARVASEFGVSERQVKESRKLKMAKGILPDIPRSHKGNKCIPQKVLDAIRKFYMDGEFVRPMPGAKQVVAQRMEDGTKTFEAQRLILCNLAEFYGHFCSAHPEFASKIKLAKFCELRPKFCKTVTTTGAHSVCVCTIHQNFKFMVEKIPTISHYTDVLKLLVCDLNNEACAMSKCDDCPGTAKVQLELQRVLEVDYDLDDIVTYSQWTNTDRSNIIKRSTTYGELVDSICEQSGDVTAHHYVKVAQSEFLKQLKWSLNPHHIIVQMDFAENYSFVVQDAAQSFYWNNAQATVHPIVVYFKSTDNSELLHISFAYISNVMAHTHAAVYTMLKDLYPRLATLLPHGPTHAHYFTDGCPGQYKSFKVFSNLMEHQNDFGLDATWHYFATSHGKSACDGIGAVVKFQARRASLQRLSTNHITTARELFDFANTNIQAINVLWYDEDDIKASTGHLEDRYSSAPSVGGSRSHHCFRRVGDSLVAKKSSGGAISLRIKYSSSTLAPSTSIPIAQLRTGDCIAYMYDHDWYIGSITDTNEKENDIEINSMHPKGPSSSFRYPARGDTVWVPLSHVIQKIDVCTTTTRQYHVAEVIQKQIITKVIMDSKIRENQIEN